MAWNPNVPTVTNRVQDDLDAIRENFQHLDQLAERVDELQTVSELAPIANDLQAVSGLASVVDDLQTVSGLAPITDDLQTVSGLAPITDDLQTVSELAPYVTEILSSRIVEMGSNSNGTYVRWENGLQICFGGQRATAMLSAYGYQLHWIYPAAFVGAPTAVGTRSNDGTGKAIRLTGPSIREISNTSVLYYINDPDGGFADGETWYVYPIAIGRWK